MTAIVCYYIQSHREPEQIFRLLRRLREGSPAAPIVLVHDSTQCDLDAAPIADCQDIHILRPSRPLPRADFSGMVQSYLEVIDWLEREGIRYEWLVNLSGQDYPVMPIAAIERFLAAASCDGFLAYWDVLSPASPWSRRKAKARYWYRYRRFPGAEQLLRAVRPLTRPLPLHVYLDYGPLLGHRALWTPFRDGFRCYGGWPWLTLRRRAVLYLRDFLAAHSRVEQHYRTTVNPEESIVQTVLANSRRFELVNDSLRFVDYSQAYRGSPRTLTIADLPELATGRYHFARKFDYAVDREVLDRIDHELLAHSAAT